MNLVPDFGVFSISVLDFETHTHTSSSCIHVFALQAYMFILMFIFTRLGESLNSYRLCRLVGRLQGSRIF